MQFPFYTSGMQPDDGHLGVAETCICNPQMPRYICAVTDYTLLLCDWFVFNKSIPQEVGRNLFGWLKS
jgi:hypothetical protein